MLEKSVKTWACVSIIERGEKIEKGVLNLWSQSKWTKFLMGEVVPDFDILFP